MEGNLNNLEWILRGLRTPKVSAIIVRALFGCAGIVFLYAAFLNHRELYVPSLQAAGVLILAITGAVLFHEAIR